MRRSWLKIISVCLAVAAGLPGQAAGAGFEGIPGDYCRIRRPQCCPSRNDDCTVDIMDTKCYCDMFCDRHDGGDCCPDFKPVCRGQTAPPDSGCRYQGQSYQAGAKTKQNCNECTCVPNHARPGENMWRCEQNPCLIQEDLLNQMSSGRYSWSASNYSDFWGMSLHDGVRYRLGTLYPERSVQNMNEILIKAEPRLPDTFDARQRWPGLVHPIRDQANCGASWAFSTTSLSADRLAIQSEGKLNQAALSAQQLLSCNQHRQKGCEGGYLDRAWWYIRKLGVVSDDCYPYTSGRTNDPGQCHVEKSLFRSPSSITCPSDRGDARIFKMTPPYRVSMKEVDIMTEIFTNGPVQATFMVHEDFYMYKTGVYQHLELARNKPEEYRKKDYHSIRVLGWGTDLSSGRPIKYWLCANSWGTGWGEEGLFKILRGENHCEIESFVIGAWGKGSKKRRRRFRLRKVKRFRGLRTL